MTINLTTNTILRAISRLAPRYAILLCVWFLEKARAVAPATLEGNRVAVGIYTLINEIKKLPETAQIETRMLCEKCGRAKRNYKTTNGTETKENVLLCPVCWK